MLALLLYTNSNLGDMDLSILLRRPLCSAKVHFQLFDQMVTTNLLSLVLALFSKTGSKNSCHAAIKSQDRISGTSRITVQVFEHLYPSQIFRQYSSFTAPFSTKGFLHLNSHHFLTVISQPTRAIKFLQNGDVELLNEDFKLFKELNGRHGEGHLKFKMQ